MAYWIKKFARIVGIISFFTIFFATLDMSNPLNIYTMTLAFIKGIAAAVLFWFAGFVIGDIVFKGVVEDVPKEEIDELEGGILQRVRQTRQESDRKIPPLKPAQRDEAALKASAKMGQKT